MTLQQIVFYLIAGLTVLMSLITLIVYAADKKKAVKGTERVKEKTLLALSASFGALGALIGRKLAHHKTNKGYFTLVIVWSLLLNAALLGFTAYLAFIR